MAQNASKRPGWNVRQPEAEENRVEAGGGWIPREQVGFYVFDGSYIDSGSVERDRLSGRVDRQDPPIRFGEMLRPEPGAARKFEHVAGRERLTEDGLDVSDFSHPLRAVLGSAIVSALAQEPLVVFAGSRAVVLDLLREETRVVHVVPGYPTRVGAQKMATACCPAVLARIIAVHPLLCQLVWQHSPCG